MVIATHISITTLKVNGLNAPTKRHRLDECIQKQDPYICYKRYTSGSLSTRDPRQTLGHIQAESEGVVKDIPGKWKSKESWSSNSHNRQNRL